MKRLDWRAFAAVGVVAVSLHFLAPEKVQGLIYLGVGAASVVAVLGGVRRHRPRPSRPWLLFAAGLTLFLIGDGFFYFYKLVRQVERPFPSVADAFYLASYPVLIAGLLSLIRRRIPGGDRPSLIDAAIIATGMALLWELYLIAPFLSSPDTPWLERVISAAYPVADVALLAVALRLAVGAGSRLASFYFMGLAVTCLLGADMAYGALQLSGSFELGTVVDAGWMGFYLFWGVASLHPTMRALSQPGPVQDVHAGRFRLAVLGAVVLVPPAVMVVQTVRGEYSGLLLAAASSVLLVLLVMARMNDLLASLATTAARERALRTAAAALVATTDRRSVYEATLEATRELLGPSAVVVRLALWSDAELASVAAGPGPSARSRGREASPRKDNGPARVTGDGDGNGNGGANGNGHGNGQDALGGSVTVPDPVGPATGTQGASPGRDPSREAGLSTDRLVGARAGAGRAGGPANGTATGDPGDPGDPARPPAGDQAGRVERRRPRPAPGPAAGPAGAGGGATRTATRAAARSASIDARIGGPPADSAPDQPLGLAELSRILEDPLGLGRPARSTVVAPVVVHDDLQGAIVVASDDRLPPWLSGTLDTLGSQVAMALESVSLTESLHRRRGEARLAALVQNSSDVITVVDPDTTVRYQTPSVRPVLGYSVGDLDGTRLVDLVHPSDLARALDFFEEAAAHPGTSAPVELRTRRPDGRWQDVEAVSNNLLGDRNVGGIVLTIRDISERKAFERQLTEQAFHDSLTGLANRSLFADRLEHALGRRHRRPGTVGVIFVDLDDFKTVNDSLGHAAGDTLLVAAAQRITAGLRPGDTIARLGADEFAIMLDEIDDPGVPVAVAERVLELIREAFTVEGKEVNISASLGIAVAGGDTTAAEDLLRDAGIAMYMAKSRSKGSYEIFEARMRDTALQRLNLRADLQRALEGDEFVLHYQPIYDLRTRQPVGFEALVRWQHPERGLLAPLEFIPLAEESGLIVGLGRRVLELACRQARRWYGSAGLTMSVNLSRKQLAHAGLVDDVAAILAAAGLPPGALTLEITESLVMHDVEATVDVLRRLRRTGVRIAIDDFGTGYSSLASLRHLPVDVLKIDKAFVDGIARSQEDLILVSTVVDLARGLGMATVAEGIEDADQLAALRAVNCSHGQGYHLSRPLPAAEAEALVHGGHR